jgi:hypothetical protein
MREMSHRELRLACQGIHQASGLEKAHANSRGGATPPMSCDNLRISCQRLRYGPEKGHACTYPPSRAAGEMAGYGLVLAFQGFYWSLRDGLMVGVQDASKRET